jgi:hypothetical protein
MRGRQKRLIKGVTLVGSGHVALRGLLCFIDLMLQVGVLDTGTTHDWCQVTVHELR